MVRMCGCTTILPLFQDNYADCAPQGAPQDKHPQRGGVVCLSPVVVRTGGGEAVPQPHPGAERGGESVPPPCARVQRGSQRERNACLCV